MDVDDFSGRTCSWSGISQKMSEIINRNEKGIASAEVFLLQNTQFPAKRSARRWPPVSGGCTGGHRPAAHGFNAVHFSGNFNDTSHESILDRLGLGGSLYFDLLY